MHDTGGFFVFDYNAMDGYYGKQAFDAIHAALRLSAGACVFHDGDVFNCETVRELAVQSKAVMPSNSESPLADLEGPFDFGAYVVGMWTDTYPNFEELHNSLVSASLPGYLGYMQLGGRHSYEAFMQLAFRQLHLPQGIILKEGRVEHGKYGIQ